jgi:quercetin dioxygenase-like cupin family protein
MTDWTPRRVITGHDADGVSTVLADGAPPVVTQIPQAGVTFVELWSTEATPAPVAAAEPDPVAGPVRLPPPRGGTRIRVNEFRPGHLVDGRQSRWHRTETVDYGIVISGELVLLLEDREVVLRPGDVVVQRGTNHAWANRGTEIARVAFVLVDGTFDPALAAQLGQEATAETDAARATDLKPPPA